MLGEFRKLEEAWCDCCNQDGGVGSEVQVKGRTRQPNAPKELSPAGPNKYLKLLKNNE